MYGACYLAGPGDQNGDDQLDRENKFFRCGLSSNVGGDSGKLFFTEAVSLDVPEPSSFALMLAGLGAMALAARRRSRWAWLRCLTPHERRGYRVAARHCAEALSGTSGSASATRIASSVSH
ncbi:MAG: PEP-CTERM sorting domain-containing protein [Rubrivivax sp.]|nr:PEP-CTERM sorting domain-containing protein [Rubrivivax sp.]